MANNTVLINVPFVESLIDSKGWSNGYFGAKIMGKSRGWVAEWKRKKDGEPAPKNLPTYEEAAKICIVFNASPDDILLHEGKTPEETAKCLEDIETVRKLVEAEGIKEAPDPKTVGVSATTQEIFDFIDSASTEEIADLLRYVQFLKSKREQK